MIHTCKKTMSRQLLLLIMSATFSVLIIDAQPMVEVEQGILMGKTVVFSENEYINMEKELDVYEGVPFADPPIRFEHPVKKAAWGDVWNATYRRPMCFQKSVYVVGKEFGEDCLYLNIYVPHGITDGAVMVWIHGGGFSTGSGSQDEYNGEPLSAVGDVIVVSLSYRVDTFGYLTTGDEVLPGNYGMMDQVQALKWVQENIKGAIKIKLLEEPSKMVLQKSEQAFGGDKNKVTIFGESAGSASVSYHLISKQSAGLFQQAIMQSGTALSTWAFQETSSARENAFQVGEALGCSASDSTVLRQCLQEATADELFSAGTEAGFVSTPCIDNFFLEDYPKDLLNKGDFHRVPIMLGSNKDEGTLVALDVFPTYITSEEPPFMGREQFEALFESEEDNPLVIESYYQQYLDWALQDKEGLDYLPTFINIMTDEPFACPTDAVARAHSRVGDHVYLYQMTHAPTVSILSSSTPNISPGWLGAGHGEELSFVFGFPFMTVNNRKELNDPEKALSVKFMELWSAFTKTGSPSMATDPEDEMYWPVYRLPDLEYKVLALNLTTDRALKADYCKFWNDFIPKIRTFTSNLSDVEREWRMDLHNWKYESMVDWRESFNDFKHQDIIADCKADSGVCKRN